VHIAESRLQAVTSPTIQDYLLRGRGSAQSAGEVLGKSFHPEPRITSSTADLATLKPNNLFYRFQPYSMLEREAGIKRKVHTFPTRFSEQAAMSDVTF
jgi:hypothetical protein